MIEWTVSSKSCDSGHILQIIYTALKMSFETKHCYMIAALCPAESSFPQNTSVHIFASSAHKAWNVQLVHWARNEPKLCIRNQLLVSIALKHFPVTFKPYLRNGGAGEKNSHLFSFIPIIRRILYSLVITPMYKKVPRHTPSDIPLPDNSKFIIQGRNCPLSACSGRIFLVKAPYSRTQIIWTELKTLLILLKKTILVWILHPVGKA